MQQLQQSNTVRMYGGRVAEYSGQDSSSQTMNRDDHDDDNQHRLGAQGRNQNRQAKVPTIPNCRALGTPPHKTISLY